MHKYSTNKSNTILMYTLLLFRRISYYILTFSLIYAYLILFATPIKAQADYMGPGVPYNAKCYASETTNYDIQAKLQTPSQTTINKEIKVPINIQTSSSVKPEKLQIALTYNSSILNISKVAINQDKCSKISQDDIKIDNTNGVATLTLLKSNCPNLELTQGDNLIANIYFTTINTGNAIITLNDMQSSPASYITTSTSETIGIKGQQYTIKVTNLQTTPTQTTNNTYPTEAPLITTTPPNTGILDNTPTLIALLLIGLGLIIYYFYLDTSKIKSSFIIYEDN